MRPILVLAAAAMAVLASACADAPTVPAGELTGMWHAAAAEGGLSTHQWMELRPEGRFAWTTETYGPGGRPEDGLLEMYSMGGAWELRGDRLALRTEYGMGWSVDGGGYQADFVGEWNTRHSVRLDGGRMLLTFNPRPEDSSTQRTTVFERAAR